MFRDDGKPPLLAIGEAKWNDTMGEGHIEHLRHIREIIARSGRYDTSETRLLCFSGNGFNNKALTAATSDKIGLVDLPTLYRSTR